MDAHQVRMVRRFNRTVTRRVGALDDSFLGRGRPLSEARLLFEIGSAGADARDLRERLALDSGYLSRLLRSLERQGLVASRRAERDARVTTVSLTDAGRAELSQIDHLADDFATSLLHALDAEQRARLVAAMADVERLMRAAAVAILESRARSADAQWCIAQYFAELGERFAGGFDPAITKAAGPDEFTPPRGWFFVARLDGRAVGCGGLRTMGDGIGEVKRMWVDRDARGLGIGRRLLDVIEARASQSGLHTLRLETNASLTEAIAMYRARGYREVPAFNAEPYAHHWFAKDLVS
jgi:DNA-binding MarR family transcriptional regulator/GNAT superfamily N-acetyltransferase